MANHSRCSACACSMLGHGGDAAGRRGSAPPATLKHWPNAQPDEHVAPNSQKGTGFGLSALFFFCAFAPELAGLHTSSSSVSARACWALLQNVAPLAPGKASAELPKRSRFGFRRSGGASHNNFVRTSKYNSKACNTHTQAQPFVFHCCFSCVFTVAPHARLPTSISMYYLHLS